LVAAAVDQIPILLVPMVLVAVVLVLFMIEIM
jgi:hypothetical protein